MERITFNERPEEKKLNTALDDILNVIGPDETILKILIEPRHNGKVNIPKNIANQPVDWVYATPYLRDWSIKGVDALEEIPKVTVWTDDKVYYCLVDNKDCWMIKGFPRNWPGYAARDHIEAAAAKLANYEPIDYEED